jgi:hypothetical protein
MAFTSARHICKSTRDRLRSARPAADKTDLFKNINQSINISHKE